MFMTMGVAGPLYAFSLFLPSIISGLGYTTIKAQLLTVPPYVAASALVHNSILDLTKAIFVGFAADRTGRRGLFNIGFALIGCTGFSILVASHNAKLSYAGTFLGAAGIYPCVANNIVWVSNNVEGVYKRGVSLGMVIAWGNYNGIMASNIYREVDAPWYRLGHSVVLGYLVVCLLGGSIVHYICLSIANRRRDAGGEKLRSKMLEGLTEEERHHLADFHPDFRYTL
jgi:MFS family permease